MNLILIKLMFIIDYIINNFLFKIKFVLIELKMKNHFLNHCPVIKTLKISHKNYFYIKVILIKINNILIKVQTIIKMMKHLNQI